MYTHHVKSFAVRRSPLASWELPSSPSMMEAVMPKLAHEDQDLARAIGDRVRRCRSAKGMTQERLAEALGVHAETVSRYETGAISASIALLYRLADVLGVQVEALLPSDHDSTSEAELVDHFRLLDGEGRALVLGLLRRLVP